MAGRGHPEGAEAEGRWEARLGPVCVLLLGGCLARSTFWPRLEWGVSQAGDHLTGQIQKLCPGPSSEQPTWETGVICLCTWVRERRGRTERL